MIKRMMQYYRIGNAVLDRAIGTTYETEEEAQECFEKWFDSIEKARLPEIYMYLFKKTCITIYDEIDGELVMVYDKIETEKIRKLQRLQPKKGRK